MEEMPASLCIAARSSGRQSNPFAGGLTTGAGVALAEIVSKPICALGREAAEYALRNPPDHALSGRPATATCRKDPRCDVNILGAARPNDPSA